MHITLYKKSYIELHVYPYTHTYPVHARRTTESTVVGSQGSVEGRLG